ncbi:carbohydrate ABC transporter permease [Caldanaerobius polysaccharolyticus]|uniref:carbohydrate ABC transporter permease n=1 Tax=Caldanaerobius polysaccharolyticus TaxID=44256 RepID=UPI00047AD1D0|nr:carbohydrate ABC transporter permease [Caldanaerobius polysaccharolyticus]
MKWDRKDDIVGKLILYLILVLLAVAYIVPFLWLFSGSLKTTQELFASPPVFIPKKLQWNNYVVALSDFPFFLYLKNTLYIIIVNIIGSVISSSLVAYGFSRIEWKGRDAVFIMVLITMMLPFQVVMIPQFLLFQKFKWIGTFLPLLVPSFFGNAFYIFLLRQFFIGIPFEISQSAKIDGANEFQTFWHIIMPMAKPAITTVVIFTFLFRWNDFIGPLIFLNNNKLYTLSIGVQQIMSANDPRWTLLMALGVIMTVPVLVLFFLLQKYFIQGISFGALKE